MRLRPKMLPSRAVLAVSSQPELQVLASASDSEINMPPGLTGQLAWLAIPALAVVGLGRVLWSAVARRRLAERVNRVVVAHRLPAVVGPLRDAACGALLGAAAGDALARRREASPSYRVGTQLMLAAARAVRPDGSLNLRCYRLELAYLHRYHRGASRPLRGVFASLRFGRVDSVAACSAQTGEALLAAVPLGIVWHDRPGHAAQLARSLAAVTHRRPEVQEAAGLIAAGVAHMVAAPVLIDETGGVRGRRAWLERVLRSARPPERDAGPAELAILGCGDLASEPPENVGEALSGRRAVDALRVGFYLALRHAGVLQDVVASAAQLRAASPHGLGIALALVGARLGAEAVRDVSGRLRDRAQVEAWGEKLVLMGPVTVASDAASLPVATDDASLPSVTGS